MIARRHASLPNACVSKCDASIDHYQVKDPTFAVRRWEFALAQFVMTIPWY